MLVRNLKGAVKAKGYWRDALQSAGRHSHLQGFVGLWESCQGAIGRLCAQIY